MRRHNVVGIGYQAAAGFEFSDVNYKTVMDILKGRFGQRQTILDCHIDAFLTIKCPWKACRYCGYSEILGYSGSSLVGFQAIQARRQLNRIGGGHRCRSQVRIPQGGHDMISISICQNSGF